MKPIINLADVELSPRPAAFAPPESMNDRYGEVRIGQIGRAIGARKLGYNLTAVPPGKRAFPCHSHSVNEEMFFVLEGTGEIRIGEARYPIRAGDVIACPPGGEDAAHQIVNTGESELRYLAVSTMSLPEVVEYPDSGKFGLLAELPGRAGEPSTVFRFVSRKEAGVGYWEGN
ncbi:cupin domain-containing protein [Paraburkholderia sp. NMBU_R16]|uniref:cupin domain-containing protein n=1 Tax=Paraburkholderia sp. NMBU_R16 TaxID=2698676 RepID=UPI001563181D|nr:cupin domain-containing protein [Paraburkholderia sp. NMBU_R16]NRO97147.1 cupin domain-containing protein [Paraburkholderia sp. NMBU_R16]